MFFRPLLSPLSTFDVLLRSPLLVCFLHRVISASAVAGQKGTKALLLRKCHLSESVTSTNGLVLIQFMQKPTGFHICDCAHGLMACSTSTGWQNRLAGQQAVQSVTLLISTSQYPRRKQHHHEVHVYGYNHKFRTS